MEHTPFYEQVKERLIRYAKIDTQSDPKSASTPALRRLRKPPRESAGRQGVRARDAHGHRAGRAGRERAPVGA